MWTDRTTKALIQEEFFSMQAICAMTAEVIASFLLSLPQKCLPKKAVFKAQSTALQHASTLSSKDSSQPAQDLDAPESSITALSQSKEGANDMAEMAGRGKTFKSLPRTHEAICLKQRSDKSDEKVTHLI